MPKIIDRTITEPPKHNIPSELKRGMIFKRNDEFYILTIVSSDTKNVSIVSLKDGNRWSHLRPLGEIRQKLINDGFLYVSDPKITVEGSIL